jgi:5-(carboxyamino)imidazole ribonucleotide synthase
MTSPILLLGGGQLGLMMAEAGAQLALHVDRLNLDNEQIIPGTSGLNIPMTAEEIIARYPVISAELEHLPDSPLVIALRNSPNWANKQAFEYTADRHLEKKLLDELQIPNSNWRFIENHEDLQGARKDLGEMVVKITRGGYDGRGQWVISDSTPDEVPSEFYGQLIAERFVNFDREVSLIGARTRDGKCIFYPLVENTHHNGILRYTLARIQVQPQLQAKAEKLLGTILEKLDYVGVMAMECFAASDELLVNELAPRVHNSGHWSQLGADQSQFALHLRALLDLPLPTSQVFRETLMLNLIGCDFVPVWLQIPALQCHWYGKSVRPGRKLGHINIDLSDTSQARKSIALLKPQLDKTHQSMLEEARAKLDL